MENFIMKVNKYVAECGHPVLASTVAADLKLSLYNVALATVFMIGDQVDVKTVGGREIHVGDFFRFDFTIHQINP